MRVGFIGLGRMGSPMAGHVAAGGFETVVFDLNPGAAAGIAGATVAASARDAAAGSDVVITMLPGPAELEAVLGGPDGALAALPAGGVWIDMSSSSASAAERIVASLPNASDIACLDAPVTGGVGGAEAATLTIFVGGESDIVERCRPVLECMGAADRVRHVGARGAGYTVKLCVNLLFFMHAAAGAEVLALGTKSGVALDVLHDCLMQSGATSAFLERDMMSVLEGDYRAYFRLALACKDMGLAVDLGRENGVPMEVGALVEQIHRRALTQYGDGGQLFAVRLMEDLVGIPMRRTGAS